MMKRYVYVAFIFAYGEVALAQVSDDIDITLGVTARPLIEITPGNDVSLASTGVTSIPEFGTVDICFETSLSDISVTVAKLNPTDVTFNRLANAEVNDYISYQLFGGVDTGVIEPGSSFNGTANPRDFDLTSAVLGLATCGATQFLFTLKVTPITDPSSSGRAIVETVNDNNLDDGETYLFSDVLTVTFEPVFE